MFKKITISVLGLAASIATAGSMGPVCTPGNVTVPCVTNLWDFSAQALYLRSIYGSEKSIQFGTLPLNKEIKNDWNWGYRLEGSYHFNTGNDVSVNWMHYSTSIDPTELAGVLVIPSIGLPPIPAPFEFISRNRIDQVNVVMGQHTDLGMRDKMRFYGGLQYANIQSTSKSYYITEEIPFIASNPFSKFDNTEYKGFGPVVGIDYAYYLTNALSLTANGSGSILIGTNRYHAGFTVYPTEAIVEQVAYRKKGVVPSLEAKLGINFAQQTPIGLANIQAGYQIVNYFHVLEAQTLPNLFGPVRTVDYGLFGPYFGLKLIGNA
ncbi:Lpg1974 family pore-forming outer membrane protein [Fluoribacter dumoffii]|uniref:Legionella pneumophila major outer membrane protein n=1 Tax=Fluoribacter dumoffii TaxID=463 RepID=A0A377G5C5_9GAMM|nr:Lpg1974 family pore-forming outer membrane protein [Fluoribacter dumoffii]KTC91530.1 outer membrane protein [Fluoribacter dumoffii NY 23]MCW8387346.1 Lpg1974 family pore-forming outer membrane protein [Fluoribacter dumoffii]MCW8417147.1 Lpg1974 family pore-forming outer membrane protein [Fluoribacter dumoffii]MCW8455013.1 Lpg1974 family pore-forming outer membrane protein [Fluoribacter dumoffii]MCW8460910.1 Lpg1974 family pore-forming outer membrane protein [Fluoribacter dumoffii]